MTADRLAAMLARMRQPAAVDVVVVLAGGQERPVIAVQLGTDGHTLYLHADGHRRRPGDLA